MKPKFSTRSTSTGTKVSRKQLTSRWGLISAKRGIIQTVAIFAITMAASIGGPSVLSNPNASAPVKSVDPEVKRKVTELLKLIKSRDVKFQDLLKGLVELGEHGKAHRFDDALQEEFEKTFKPAVSKALKTSADIIEKKGASLLDDQFEASLTSLLQTIPQEDPAKQKVFEALFKALVIPIPIKVATPEDSSKIKRAATRCILAGKDAHRISFLLDNLDSTRWASNARAIPIYEISFLHVKGKLDEVASPLVMNALNGRGKICSGVLLIMGRNRGADETGIAIHREMALTAMSNFGNLAAAHILIESLKKLEASAEIDKTLKTLIAISSKLAAEDKKQLQQALEGLKLKGNASEDLLKELKSSS